VVNTDRGPSSTKRAARMDAGSGAAHAGVGGGGEGCTDTWSVGDKVRRIELREVDLYRMRCGHAAKRGLMYRCVTSNVQRKCWCRGVGVACSYWAELDVHAQYVLSCRQRSKSRESVRRSIMQR